MPRVGSKRKKTRTHVNVNNHAEKTLISESDNKIPRSLAIRKGKVKPEIISLLTDVRLLLSPHTAISFQENARNRKASLYHYSKFLCKPMGITHILSISQKEYKIPMKLALIPHGPTLTFHILKFMLMRQVRASQKRPYYCKCLYQNSPIVVTNNFGDHTAQNHVKLLRIVFQGLFPALNIATVKLSDYRRVVLFNLIRCKGNVTDDTSSKDDLVELRHYAIRATPIGVSKKVRKLIHGKRLPNLSNYQSMEEYILGKQKGDYSDSETEVEEDTEDNPHVLLPQSYIGKGNDKSQKSALRLVELGPRLQLRLCKVEKELGKGDVLYSTYLEKPDLKK